MRTRFVLLLSVLSLGLGSAWAADVSLFREGGYGVDWGPASTGQVAIDQRGSDGYFDVYLTNSIDTNVTCLTCDHPQLPNRHQGGPRWHPSGKYIVFAVEQSTHPGSSDDAIPGYGAYSDLWVVSPSDRSVTKLTSVPADLDHGTIIPFFSHDGSKLIWTERKARPNLFIPKQWFGYWIMHVADFVDGPAGPHLENIRLFEPGGDAFYEAYGLSPDETRLIFCSNMNGASGFDQDIYTLDLQTGADLRRLTNGGYNEHAVYAPDGGFIVWMSNNPSGGTPTNWWRMDPDGSNKSQITHFNESGHPHFWKTDAVAGLVSFSPDGTRLLGTIQEGALGTSSRIVMVELAPAGGGTGLLGEYFKDATLTDRAVAQKDAYVSYDWGLGAPMPNLPIDNFSVRWSGLLEPRYSETTTFTIKMDDGVRVWVDGKLIIDDWNPGAEREVSGTASLVAGKKIPIRVEYFDATGIAKTRLQWSSANQLPQVVPTATLYPLFITHQPENVTVMPGQAASFSVIAEGAMPFTYQWQKQNGSDWNNIAQATSATYALSSTSPQDNSSQFRCVVSNLASSAVSNGVKLTVSSNPENPPLGELSGTKNILSQRGDCVSPWQRYPDEGGMVSIYNTEGISVHSGSYSACWDGLIEGASSAPGVYAALYQGHTLKIIKKW